MITTEITDSILNSTKKVLGGIDPSDTAFDQDIIMSINAAFMTLNQIGVGPTSGFVIAGPDETWQDFVDNTKYLSAIPQYIYIKTRLIFDPPTNSAFSDALKKQAEELEWRLQAMVETDLREEG